MSTGDSSHLYDQSQPGPPMGSTGGWGDVFGATDGPGRMAQASTAGSYGNGNHGVRYPSPFFDLATTYMPKSIKQLFHWCAYYFKVNPLINAVVTKMSEYPITPIIVDEDDQDLKRKYEELIEHDLQIRKFQIEVNLDYNCFGNSFTSVSFPFDKYITCKQCGDTKKLIHMRPYYRWRNLKFELNCPRCGHHGKATVKDHYVKDVHRISLVRWSPMNIDVDYNHVTGRCQYYYTIPLGLKNDILLGKKSVLEQTPDVFIEAARKGKQAIFDESSVFHLKRPTIAEESQGWGIPMIMPVLKDVFYLQVLRKGQEAIAQEHIVPLRIIFPQGGDALSSPYSTTNLGTWRERVELEIGRWRLDPNYIPVLPLPIGHQLIGGQGRAMVLHQELRVWAEHIVAGMGVPQEFVFGGLQYSGSNVSMRMLENQFIGNRSDHLIMVRDFILGRVADFMDWPKVKIDFEKFRMADDLQRISLYFQANQAQKISDTTFLTELGEDLPREEELKQKEVKRQIEAQKKMQLAQAEIQGQQQYIQMKWQQKAMALGVPVQPPGQQAPPPQRADGQMTTPEGATAYAENSSRQPVEGIPAEMQSPLTVNEAGKAGVDAHYFAKRAAHHIESQSPQNRQPLLNEMKMRNPLLHDLVVQIIQSRKGSNQSMLDPAQKPLAEQRPSRSPTPPV